MRQTNDQFIQVLNRFWIVTHNLANITLLNHTYLRPPPNDLNFPYMYYINKSTKEKNYFIFQNKKGQEYVFDVDDQHHDTCPKHSKWKNGPSQIVGLHSKIQIKIGMLIELCVGIMPIMTNYSMELMGFFNIPSSWKVMNPLYGLVLIILKLDL